MIHVVFQQADVAKLKEAIALDNSLAGEVVEIKDDYAVGPVEALYELEGYQARRAWWKSLLDVSPYNTRGLMEMVDDRLAVHNLKKQLDENARETVWIWMGQNSHDVCGYYWLVAQLKDYQGRIFVLYFNNLPFINEKGGIFYPSTLHEVLPKEFLKAKKLCRAITKSEFEIDPDEWNRLGNENAIVRILEGGKKIVSKDAHFFDTDILNSLTGEWQKGNRAMHTILSKMKIKTGDVFLLWRMKHLVEEGKLELTGDPTKGWKEFEIKITPASTQELEEPLKTATQP
jgi:hypothetical protein